MRATAADQVRPTVYIDAATQIDNLGDDIILRQLLRMIEARADAVVDVSNVPEWAREVIAVNPATALSGGGFTKKLLVQGLRRQLTRRGPKAALVLKPGHIGGRYGWRHSIARGGLLGLTVLCRLLGITVIRVGFSVDDCQGALKQIERLQSRAQHVYAPRDEISVAYAGRTGIRVTGRSTDLAYTLGVTRTPGIERTGTVLSFSGSTDGHVQDDYAQWIHDLLDGYLGLAERSGSTDMTWCAQVVRDAQFGDRVLANHPAVSRLSFTRDLASAEKIFALYASTDVVLTNRLHSFLFSLSQGALAIVLTEPDRHGKIVGIIEEMGLPQLLIPVAGTTPAALAERIESLRQDRDHILDLVAKYFELQTERMDKVLDGCVGSVRAAHGN